MTIRFEALPTLEHPDREIDDWVELDDWPEIATIYGGNAAVLGAPSWALPGATNTIKPNPSQPNSATSLSSPPWSTALQTVLDRPASSFPHSVVLGGLVFCTAFAGWASTSKIDEVGRAPGRLVPQGETYKVHPAIGGKIAKVLVREGQPIKAGQIIAQLDDEMALNRVESLQQQQVSFAKELMQTEAMMDKTRLEAQTRLAISHAEINAQNAVIDQAQAKMVSQNAAIRQAEERAITSKALVTELETDAAAQSERMERLKYLVNEGALPREQVFQAERILGERKRSITQQMGDIQQTFAESQRLRAELQQVVAESQRLQAELARKQAEGDSAQLQSQQTIQQLTVQKIQIQAKIQQNQKQLAQAKAELKQLTLTAPVNGVVLALNVHNQGEMIQPGQTIAEMVPQGVPLILEAALPTREAGFVKVGDRTQIKFDAFPYQEYGIVTGQVTSISPTAKTDERLGAVYRVEITIDPRILAQQNPKIQLKAGQTAAAEIVIRQRRIADILLEPIQQLQTGGLNL